MEYRNATKSDLAHVFRNNDERMTAEYVTAGFNPRSVEDIFRGAVVDGSAHSLLHEGEPLAIIVWNISDGSIETGFAAKPQFFDRRYVRFCKEHIRLIQAQNGNLPIVAISYAIHPHLDRWFAAIGFQRGVTRGKATLYGLPPA